MRLNDTSETNAVLLTASKKFNVGMQSDIHQSNWFKVGMMIDTIEVYI